MLCARLEGVATMLEARSAALGEAQLRAILLEHQSAIEAQQLAQAKTLTRTRSLTLILALALTLTLTLILALTPTLSQAKKLRDEMRGLADLQRQQTLSMASIASTLANLEARGGGGGGGGGGISLGMADAHQLHEKMESGKEVTLALALALALAPTRRWRAARR